MSTTPNPKRSGRRITRTQAAELAGLSVDTIRRRIRTHGLTTDYDEDTGECLLVLSELVEHGIIDPTQASVPEAALTRSRTERDNRELRARVEQLTALNDRLTDEIMFLRSAIAGRAA